MFYRFQHSMHPYIQALTIYWIIRQPLVASVALTTVYTPWGDAQRSTILQRSLAVGRPTTMLGDLDTAMARLLPNLGQADRGFLSGNRKNILNFILVNMINYTTVLHHHHR